LLLLLSMDPKSVAAAYLQLFHLKNHALPSALLPQVQQPH